MRFNLSLGRFRVAEDCAGDVIETMSDSARQGADGLHAACLLQTRFQSIPVPLEKLSFDGIGDSVEGHTQQTQLARWTGGLRSHGIQTEHPFEAAFTLAPEAQPATYTA